MQNAPMQASMTLRKASAFDMRMPRVLAILASLWLGSAWAAPAFDLPGETLLAQSSELRSRLNLNASQAGAWLQAESRTRAMLRERRARRERLQMDMESALANNQNGLAELASRIDADESQSLEENRSLRQGWLHIFESLDAAQRRTVAETLHAQLEPQPTQTSPAPRAAEDSPRRGKGSRGLGGLGGGSSGF